MTETRTKSGRLVRPVVGLKALPDEGPGIFSAWVSVFGNRDLQGDRVMPGFFAESLEEWERSGDPVPVIFSHRWDDVAAHIGEVVDAREDPPGSSNLPAEIREYGGLWTKFSLDVAEPDTVSYARRVSGLLERRRIREFSFAYDVLDEERLDDGSYALRKGTLIEVGPTLKGANPLTHLAGRGPKSASPDDLVSLELAILDEYAEGEKSSTAETKGTLAEVTFAGSYEERLDGIQRAATSQAIAEDLGEGGFYALYLDATFEDSALVLVEGWNDPVRQGSYYSVGYTMTESGVELAEWDEVVVEGVIREKSARRERDVLDLIERRSAKAKRSGGTLGRDSDPDPAKSGQETGKSKDPATGKGEDPEPGPGEEPSEERSTELEDDLELELEVLNLDT